MRGAVLASASLVVIAVACAAGGEGSNAEVDPGSPTDPAPAAPTTTATPAPPSSPLPESGAPDAPDGPLTAAVCFQALAGSVQGPDYDQFKPVIAKSCAGTHHQAIAGIERLVFLGDSITEGTPPTLPNQYYRSIVTTEVQKRFPGVAVSNCAAWGARTDDFLQGKDQIPQCFPSAAETSKKTLVVMTMGGNDIANWAKNGMTTAQATVAADAAAKLLRDAVLWLKTPGRFTKGVDVVFANVYEYTDASGDLLSCPTAILGGLSGNWPQGGPAVVHFQEQYMKLAVETKTDMVFLFEHFCGHGYRRNDATLQCYRGPNAELWFDSTCTHPSPTGHAQIADLFRKIIDGK
jgi:lysophospholipase L1-like esterase